MIEIETSDFIEELKEGLYQNLNKKGIDKVIKEIERLNNIIEELEKDLEKIFEKMKEKLVEIDGRGYYYTDLIPIEDTLDKLKELKGE